MDVLCPGYLEAMFRTILAFGVENLGNSIQMKPVPPSEKQRELVLIGEPPSNQNNILENLIGQPKNSQNLFCPKVLTMPFYDNIM